MFVNKLYAYYVYILNQFQFYSNCFVRRVFSSTTTKYKILGLIPGLGKEFVNHLCFYFGPLTISSIV